MREHGRGTPRNLSRARWWLGALAAAIGILLLIGDPDHGVPERLAEGKHIRPRDYRRTYGWYAGAFNGGALLVLCATSAWWVGREEPASTLPPHSGRPGARLRLGVGAACVVLAGSAALRLDHSYWRDEEMTVAHYIDGEWYRHSSGEYRFHSLSWASTLWNYDSPNNHVGYSFLARVSQDVYNGLFERGPFASEIAVRVPAWIAGIAAVASLAWLAWRVASPEAALLAAWLSSLHPWWLRYASEARGYAFVLLGATLLPLLSLRALERGSWRRWLALGAATCAFLWINGSLVFLVALLNGAMILEIFSTKRSHARGQQLGRLLVANALGALAFVQLMLPNVMQIGPYMERTRGTRDLGGFLIPEALSHLLVGTSWHHRHDADPGIYPELLAILSDHPLFAAFLLGTTALAGVAALVASARRGRFGCLLLGIYLLAPPLTWLVAYLRRDAVYPWYFVFALPGYVLITAQGLAVMRSRLARWLPRASYLLPVAVIGCLLVLTAPVRTALIERPIKSERDSVLLTRSDLDPRAPQNARITTVQFPDRPQFYDPRMLTVRTLEDLERVIAGVDREGHALYVNYGRHHHVRKHRPELVARVEAADFERVAVLHGLGPDSTRFVYRWRGSEARRPHSTWNRSE